MSGRKKVKTLRNVMNRLQRRGYQVSMRRTSSNSPGRRTLQASKSIGGGRVSLHFDVNRGGLKGHKFGSGSVLARTSGGKVSGRTLAASRIKRDHLGRFAS